jgi:hypothetical protein
MQSAFNWVKAMLRTLLGAATLAILLAGAANAQYNGGGSSGNTSGGDIQMNMLPDGRRHLTPEEAQREREIESRYNETVSDKIPDKKSSNDPWGGIRSGPAPTSAAKQRK